MDITNTLSKIKLGLLSAFVVAAGFGVRGCSDRQNAEQTLEKMGYTQIKYEGHPWLILAGSKGDLYADEFSALPPGGKQKMDVIVTSGLFKASTIRVK